MPALQARLVSNRLIVVFEHMLTEPIGFPEFHRYALNKATSILQMQGKIKGASEAPHSDCQPSDYGISPLAEHMFIQENFESNHGLRIQIEL